MLSAAMGALAHRFKQPLILGYIIAGIILGPSVAGMIKEKELMETLSTLGVTFLLFLVGLELDFRKIREVGKIAVITGVGQIVFTTALGLAICLLLGFDLVASGYIAVALAFSSTIIAVKFLSDKNETNSLYGRILVGFLLVQDFIALLVLILIKGSNSEGDLIYLSLISTLAKGIFLISAAVILSRTLLPRLFSRIAKSQELLFLTSLSWCFIFAIASVYIGLSIEIGAFLAGVSLASLPYTVPLVSKVKPLRDFFITIFFVSLGLHMAFVGGVNVIIPVVVLSLLVIIGNPIVVMIIMGLSGYKSRISFFTSITIAQISEFSLIVATLGLKVGHINQEIVSIITLVGIITISVSSFMILHVDELYRRIRQKLKIFERKHTLIELPEGISKHWILFGYHRMGYHFLKKLQASKKDVVVVDFNPKVVSHLKDQGANALYGDSSDPEILETAHLDTCEVVLSSIGNIEISKALLKNLESRKKNLKVILTTDQFEDALELYKLGADYVIVPHLLGALALDDLIDETLASGSKQSMQSLKTEQVKLISQQIKDLGSQALSTRN